MLTVPFPPAFIPIRLTVPPRRLSIARSLHFASLTLVFSDPDHPRHLHNGPQLSAGRKLIPPLRLSQSRCHGLALRPLVLLVALPPPLVARRLCLVAPLVV